MASRLTRYDLEHVTDYQGFESFCNDLMSRYRYRGIQPLGGMNDKGRDAIYVDTSTGASTVFSYSVRKDWEKKLDEDLAKVSSHKHHCDTFTFVTTARITPSQFDHKQAEVKRLYGYQLDVFDLERICTLLDNHSPDLVARHVNLFSLASGAHTLRPERVDCPSLSSEETALVVPDLLAYLDSVAAACGTLPRFFPIHLRSSEAAGGGFDGIFQMPRFIEDRAGFERHRVKRREAAPLTSSADVPTPPLTLPWTDTTLDQFRRVVILGGPGSGKSWLLRWEARRRASDAAARLREDPTQISRVPLPIYVQLPKLAAMDGPLKDRLVNLVMGQRRAAGIDPVVHASFETFVADTLCTAQSVLLLDGWDAVSTDLAAFDGSGPVSPRQRLAGDLADFSALHRTPLVILTSRPIAYDSTPPFSGLREIELVDLAPTEMESFAKAWYDRESGATAFVARLDDPRVAELARIPLLLSMLCRADVSNATALTRAALYERCLLALLREWPREDRGRHVEDQEVAGFVELLAEVCYRLREKRLTQFRPVELREILLTSLSRLSDNHELKQKSPTDIVKRLKDAGLLVPVGEFDDDRLMFLHETFEEYLAARALRSRIEAAQDQNVATAAIIAEKGHLPEWHEVIVLLASQVKAPAAFLKHLDSPAYRELHTAAVRDLEGAALACMQRGRYKDALELWEWRMRGGEVGLGPFPLYALCLAHVGRVTESETLAWRTANAIRDLSASERRVDLNRLLAGVADSLPESARTPTTQAIGFMAKVDAINVRVALDSQGAEPSHAADERQTTSPRMSPDAQLDALITNVKGYIRDEQLPARARMAYGTALGLLGDSRFRFDAWFLFDDSLLGFIEIPAGKAHTYSGKAFGVSEPIAQEAYLSRYFIGRYPVTVMQFAAFVADTGFVLADAAGLEGVWNHPITRVTWHEAIEYCRWLTRCLRKWQETPAPLRSVFRGRRTSWAIQLPTNMQWDKAAQGRHGMPFAWTPFDSFENSGSDPMSAGCTSAVGCFPSGMSVFGVEDLGGNVWEWTADAPTASEIASDAFSILFGAQEAGTCRIVRGGSYKCDRSNPRDPRRQYFPIGLHAADVGFRVVVSEHIE